MVKVDPQLGELMVQYYTVSGFTLVITCDIVAVLPIVLVKLSVSAHTFNDKVSAIPLSNFLTLIILMCSRFSPCRSAPLVTHCQY
jgi:hypothetical protein